MAIVCTSCGEDTFVRREPVYEGFRKTGEQCICVACGHVYGEEQHVPFKTSEQPAVFSEDDRARPVTIFSEDERGRNCRYCRHYVVNPFLQRCGLHGVTVEATDVCDDFSKREEQQKEEDDLDDPLTKRLRSTRGQQ